MTNPPDVSSDEHAQSNETAAASSPHDALFFSTFKKPENAIAFLKDRLPKQLVERIDWSDFTSGQLKFVDAQLTGKHADLLFSTRISGREALIYFLVEHKSTSDIWTP